MKNMKRIKQTEDDRALKEARKRKINKERKKHTKKDKGNNEGRVDDRKNTQNIQNFKNLFIPSSDIFSQSGRLSSRLNNLIICSPKLVLQ